MNAMQSKTLDGPTFVRLIHGGAERLEANADIVNDLNVFPIPDGDTGANMTLTIGGGLHRVDGYTGRSIDKASALLADGMVLSARGNSGVILSQLFAGIARGLEGKETATVGDLALAMKDGVKNAYAAVINPTEGTILTVAREASDYAASRVTAESTIGTFGEDYLKELEDSLQRTPDLLDVLKEAGVIDSGGAGLYYIVDGMVATARGEQVTAGSLKAGGEADDAEAPAPATPDVSAFTKDSVMEYGYCTEFLLQLQTIKCDVDTFSVNALIDYLKTLGDSIVAFQTGSVVKVHVHTMTPGTVLTHCQKYGEFLTVKVENMTIQHHEYTVQNRFDPAARRPAEEKRKKYAVVAVATGEGIKKTFTDLGADVIIEGGQGNNPSTEDFTDAFRRANADTIFVLPNNGNTILAARQAAELDASSDVRVIESRNIGEGYAALTMLSYDSDDPDQIAADLSEAIEGVETGMVSRAIRDASLGGVDVKEGEYIGFTDRDMLASDADKIAAALSLLQALHAADHEVLIVLYGTSATLEDKKRLAAALRASFPRTEVYEIDGGQDVYDFNFVLE